MQLRPLAFTLYKAKFTKIRYFLVTNAAPGKKIDAAPYSGSATLYDCYLLKYDKFKNSMIDIF
jgi:hypothetical protein